MSVPYEQHRPVLLQPALEALNTQPGGRYVDATLGAGGHAAGILERSSPDGEMLGLDRDPLALEIAGRRLASYRRRVTLVQEDFARLGQLARDHGFVGVQGVLFDLGVSSMQLDQAERGFSFQADAPLDMRFDPTAGESAAELLGRLGEEELADVLWRYGEERLARRIARRIVQVRQRSPLRRTGQLARLVEQVAGLRRARIHPATRTFMALRIAVNRELERLPQGLEQAVDILGPGGRLVVISFHSLEDRLVKQFIRREVGSCTWPVRTPVEACPNFGPPGQHARPCRGWEQGTCSLPARLRSLGRARRPDPQEITQNPRARSARMRVAERVGDADQ